LALGVVDVIAKGSDAYAKLSTHLRQIVKAAAPRPQRTRQLVAV
jgi:hypothetical protein